MSRNFIKKSLVPASHPFLHPEAASFEMMFCKKHARPKGIPEEYKEICPRDANPRPRYKRVLKAGEKRGDCICDYYEYPQLRNERESSKNTNAVEVFRFMDLPVELRLKCYEQALVFNAAIEFCPEPFYFSGGPLTREHQRDWMRDFRMAEKYHKDFMKHEVVEATVILRLNKTINKEATPVFFQGNEFRFSNTCGWIGIDFWMHRIGLANCQFLRHITVSPADLLRLPNSQNAANYFSEGVLHVDTTFNWHTRRQHPGFLYESRWFEDPITTDPKLVLEKAKELKELTIVVPLLQIPTFSANIVDVSKFENLKTKIVALHSDKDILNPGGTTEEQTLQVAKETAGRVFAASGEVWEAELKVVDGYGRY